jgi:hypothetical protein
MNLKGAACLMYVLLLSIVCEVAPRKLQQAPPLSHVVPRTFIVQLSGDNVATPAFAGISATQPETAAAGPPSAVLQDVHAADLDVTEINSFDSDIFKGIVVKAASDEAAVALLQHLNDDGRVASIFPVVSCKWHCCCCMRQTSVVIVAACRQILVMLTANCNTVIACAVLVQGFEMLKVDVVSMYEPS